jgi:hypothetical protein
MPERAVCVYPAHLSLERRVQRLLTQRTASSGWLLCAARAMERRKLDPVLRRGIVVTGSIVGPYIPDI